MTKQYLLCSTPEAADHARGMFTGMTVLYANGAIPPEAMTAQDALAVSTDTAWLSFICALLADAQCARIRQAAADLTQATTFAEAKALLQAAPITEYKSSAPSDQSATVPPPFPSGPKVAEPTGSLGELQRDLSDAVPAWHSDIPDDYPDEPSHVDRVRMASNVVHLRAVEDRPSGEWPEPVNFWTKSPLPAFDPLWIIPAVRPFVLNQAAMVGCDPGITWLQTVAFAAGCLSDDIRVRVRPQQDWAESARIWACVVGDSGDGKSPSMDGIMRPSRELNVEIAEASKHRQAAYKDELDLFEMERKAWLTKRQKQEPAGPRPIAPPKPVNEMLYFNDTTSEGLNDQQEASTRGTMCHADEFLGWLLGMDQYKEKGKGSDRQYWLSSWSGAEYIGVRSGKLRNIPNTGVTIVGGSQPGAIRRAVASLDLDSDGLLQRVLVYNSQGEASEENELPADRAAVNRWKAILHRLYHMKTHLDHCVFSAQSHAIRREANEWIKQMRSLEGVPLAARQALSKWRAYLPRIALTLHAIEAAEQGLEVIPATIEEHTTATAWEYMRGCLWPHMRYLYETITETAEDRTHLIAFANYVLGRGMEEVRPAYLSSKWTHYQRKIKSIHARKEFWDSVVQAGWARPAGGFDRTGQIAAVYTINPAVFRLFAEQAEAARLQIEKYRDAIPASFRREPGSDG